MTIIYSQYIGGVAVYIAAVFFLALPHSATSQLDVCSDPELSSIIKATTPESQLVVVEDILRKIAPDLISTGTSGDASTRLNVAYTRLAERFKVRATRAGFTNFVEALTAISVAQAEACSSDLSSVNSSMVADLVKAFDREFRLPDRDLDHLRSLFGKLLCIDSVSVYMRMYASMMWRGKRQAIGCPPGTSCTCPPGGLSSVVCSCQFFRCLDPDDHLKPIFGFSPTLSQCLAFVIDTTGSMANEIATARKIILEFLQSEEQIGILGCYLLVPFNDNGSPATSVGPIRSANAVFLDELEAFYNTVNALTASGGGDFPEYALDGMLQGLTYQEEFTDPDGNVFKFDIMSPGSQMIVITDATSKRPEIKDMVIKNAVSREVCIHFFLSRNPVGDGVYPDVATGTSGTLIPNFADWQLAQFVAQYSNNPCAYSTGSRGKRQVSPPETCHTFDVSTLAVNLKLVSTINVAGVPPSTAITLTVTRPNGTVTLRNVGPSDSPLTRFDVFTEGLPQPGKWSICTNPGTFEAVLVTAQNSLDIIFRYKNAGLIDTGIMDSPPPACSIGRIVTVTTRKNIRMPKLRLIGRGELTVDFPTNCSGAVLVSSPIVFPSGRFTYRFEGVDEVGIGFEHDTGKEVVFGSSEGQSLTYAGDANVEISASATKSLVFVIRNTDLYAVGFNLSASHDDGFSAVANPSRAVVPAGGAVRVQIDVQLTSDTLPDKSSHEFVLTASNECKTLTASTVATVSRCGLDCQNGGKCVKINYRGIELTRCQCPSGFSGTLCQIGARGAVSAAVVNQQAAQNQQQRQQWQNLGQNQQQWRQWQ